MLCALLWLFSRGGPSRRGNLPIGVGRNLKLKASITSFWVEEWLIQRRLLYHCVMIWLFLRWKIILRVLTKNKWREIIYFPYTQAMELYTFFEEIIMGFDGRSSPQLWSVFELCSQQKKNVFQFTYRGNRKVLAHKYREPLHVWLYLS